jgi:hypothetical protein
MNSEYVNKSSNQLNSLQSLRIKFGAGAIHDISE